MSVPYVWGPMLTGGAKGEMKQPEYSQILVLRFDRMMYIDTAYE